MQSIKIMYYFCRKYKKDILKLLKTGLFNQILFMKLKLYRNANNNKA
jgi:hypothetical protein